MNGQALGLREDQDGVAGLVACIAGGRDGVPFHLVFGSQQGAVAADRPNVEGVPQIPGRDRRAKMKADLPRLCVDLAVVALMFRVSYVKFGAGL
jgi:thioredoxin reductase